MTSYEQGTSMIDFKKIYFMVCGVVASGALNNYFLCGPDEDGCLPPDFLGCICMPLDKLGADNHYCLNWNTLACVPARNETCPANGSLFSSQANCVATVFQSEAEPNCPTVPEALCHERHAALCLKDQGPEGCVLGLAFT